jgi:GT2 family glycosyltransferase
VSRIAGKFPGVGCLRLSRRTGFCTSVNQGIRNAGGKIVEVLNDDTVATPGWAAAALACFGEQDVGAVAPLVLNLADGTIDSAGDYYYVGGIAGKRGHGRTCASRPMSVQPVFGASGSSAFYRREALLGVGAFPESFRAYFEDADLSFRLHRAGWKVLFQPESRIHHHVSSSYGPPRGRLLEQQSQNEERVFWRNLPWPALLFALPRHVAVVVAKAGRRFEEGNLRSFLCGRLRVLGELPDLWRHRRWLDRLGPSAPASAWQVDERYRGRAGGWL